MSAAPNSFEETNFNEPRFQLSGAFTSDYDRVGPEIRRNTLLNNSLNASVRPRRNRGADRAWTIRRHRYRACAYRQS